MPPVVRFRGGIATDARGQDRRDQSKHTDPRTHHSLCRIGAGLVGIDSSGTTRLHPALALTAPVVAVRRVRAGRSVGYGHFWAAPADTTLGLLAVGYADGLPRAASGRASWRRT